MIPVTQKPKDIIYFAYTFLAEIFIVVLLFMWEDSSGLGGLIVLPFLLVAIVVNPILIMRAIKRLRISFDWMDIARIVVYGIAFLPFVFFVLSALFIP